MGKFIAGMLSDDQGRPSSQRVFMLMITLFVMAALGAAQYKMKEWALPTIPDSYGNLVEWLMSTLGLGIIGPKVMNGIQAIKGAPDAGQSQG